MKIFKKFLKIIVSFITIIILAVINYFLIINFDEITIGTGIIDKDENVIVGFNYYEINENDVIDGQNQIYATRKDDTMVYINLKERKEMHVENNPAFKNGRAIGYSLITRKEGFIDENYNKITEMIYDEVTHFSEDGYARVYLDGKRGVIDLDGNEVISCKYDDVGILSKNLFCVEIDGKEYFINSNEDIIMEVFENGVYVFEDLNDFSGLGATSLLGFEYGENTIIVLNNEKYALYDLFGNQLTEYIFDDFEYINDEYGPDRILVTADDEEYIINEKGEKIFECKDYFVKNMINDYIFIFENSGYGVIDSKENIIIQAEYDDIEYIMKSDCFSVEKDNCYGVLDNKGNTIIECSSKYKSMLIGNENQYIAEVRDVPLTVILVCANLISLIIIIFIIVKIFPKKVKK